MITLASDVFKVEYILADFKEVFKLILIFFSNAIKFLRYMLLLEMYRKVLRIYILLLK